MWLKKILGLALILGLSGCAAMRHGSSGDMSSDQVQMRIGQLEQQLEQKDDEISDLKDQVESLSDEVKKKESYSSSRSSRSYSNDSASSYKKEGTLRVDVSPDQVQLALKNAGFYNGTVDGKIGERTKKAIADFQKAHNLNPDGIIGRKTWEELKAYLD